MNDRNNSPPEPRTAAEESPRAKWAATMHLMSQHRQKAAGVTRPDPRGWRQADAAAMKS